MQAQVRSHHVASAVGLVPAKDALANVKGGQLLLEVEGAGMYKAATAGAPLAGPLACEKNAIECG